MEKEALVIIDIQNDITKNYKEIINNVNAAIKWAKEKGIEVVYIKHNNLTPGTKTFKPNTKGEQLVSELKIVSNHIFTKSKSNVLTSEAFLDFINDNNILTFYLAGGDATACVKSTAFNMVKSGYKVTIFSDCVTSYDKKKIPEMLEYYKNKGCLVTPFCEK